MEPTTYDSAGAFLKALQGPSDDPFRGPSLPLDGSLYCLHTPEPPRAPTFSVDAYCPRWHWQCGYGENLKAFESTSDRDAALLTYLAATPASWPCGTARVSE